MNKVFFTVLLSLFGLCAIAQEATIQAADKLYNEKAFAEAIPKYEKVVKKDSSNVQTLSKLGDCYRLTNNTKGQIICYGKLVKDGKAEDLQKFYYGKALMSAGRYDEAKVMMDQFKEDDRGKEFSKAIANMKAFSKNEDAYKIDTVNFNSAGNDFAAIFYKGDKNKIVFTSSRGKTQWINKKHAWTDRNYYGLYMVEKGPDGKFGPPKLFMSDLQSKYNDGPICLSKDGETVYFTRNNASKEEASKDGFYKLGIFQATLSRDGFENVLAMPFNSKEYNCAHPTISADGTTLYFASDMGGSYGGMDIYMSKKGSDGKWGTPVNLGNKVNTKGNEVFPYMTLDNLLYFASDGHDGLGGLDVFEVKMKDDKPGKVYNMGKPINTSADDFAMAFAEDKTFGYLSSNRKGDNSNDDIYRFDVLRVVKRGKTVNFVVKDKDSGEPLANAKLQLNADSVRTNDKGEAQYLIEEDVNYTITASKTKYFEAKDSVSTKSSDDDEFSRTITLEKDPNLSLLAFVLDAKTNQALEGVKISIKDVSTGKPFDEYVTPATGEYKKPLKGKKIGDKLSFVITLEKQGYLSKTLNFNYDITKEGEIHVNDMLALTIGKIEVGGDLAKMIDMKPIYFDKGKSNIRKDAAIELDKVVAAMKQYPEMIIELGAHTDCRSSAASNLKLSTARAKASVAYIVTKGKIDKKRITAKGYGESKLLNGCACEGNVKSTCTEEEHAKNRRTEFIIVKLK